MTYIPNPTTEEGGQKKVQTGNLTQEELLGEILKQLKIMNFHLSILTDNDIKKTEV